MWGNVTCKVMNRLFKQAADSETHNDTKKEKLSCIPKTIYRTKSERI